MPELRASALSLSSKPSTADDLVQKTNHDCRLALRDFAVAFASLPDEQREVLIVIGASGLSCKEAAQTCSCKDGTIKSRLNRGCARLAELLESAENAPQPETAPKMAGPANLEPGC